MPIKNERAHRLKKLYNISPGDYDDLYRLQGGVCAICQQPERRTIRNRKTGNFEQQHLSVEHDHLTGKVRGLTCDDCNTALGKVRDNVNTLRRMIAYLQGTLSNATN